MVSYLASHTPFDAHTRHTHYSANTMAHILPFNPQTTTITPTQVIDSPLAVTLTVTLTLTLTLTQTPTPSPKLSKHSPRPTTSSTTIGGHGFGHLSHS